jgi:hypothetical protein
LTHLLLASEFAYRFKFTMLHECPALEKLHLHIKTSTYRAVPHSRVISKSDIVFITGAVDNASSAQRKEESIVVPALHSLHLEGRWSFEDHDTMHQFLVEMFPNLERLGVRGGGGEGRLENGNVMAWCDGMVSVALWAKLLRTTLSHVRLLTTDLEGPLLVSKEERVQWGMICMPIVTVKGVKQKHDCGGRGVFKKKESRMLSNRLFCAGREYVLLRERPPRKRGGKKKKQEAA